MSSGRGGATSGPAAGNGPTRSQLISSSEAGRLRCVINRPGSLNALTPELLFDLARIVRAAGADEEVRTVTIEGSGSAAFSAGFDIKVLAEQGAKAHRGDPLGTVSEAILSCPKTTIAVIRGHCVGAGLDLAMSCDFRVAAEGSRFSIPAVRLGTFYRPRAVERFFEVLGPSVAKALFVAAREYTGVEALRAGIIDDLVAPEHLEERVAEWSTVPEQGVAAAEAHKRLIDALAATPDRGPDFWAPFDELREHFLASGQRAEAVESFVRRRRGIGRGGAER